MLNLKTVGVTASAVQVVDDADGKKPTWCQCRHCISQNSARESVCGRMH